MFVWSVGHLEKQVGIPRGLDVHAKAFHRGPVEGGNGRLGFRRGLETWRLQEFLGRSPEAGSLRRDPLLKPLMSQGHVIGSHHSHPYVTPQEERAAFTKA